MNGHASDNAAREGRTTSILLTAELMTEHKRNKNVLTVELTRKKSEYGSDVYQQTYQDVGSTYSTIQNSNNNRNLGLSLSNKYTLKLPVWLESTTNLRYNSKKDGSDERYFESGSDTRQQGLQVLDSLFHLGVAVNVPSMISSRKQLINSGKKEYSASQNFSFAKNLYSSDIVDFSAGIDYTKSTNDRDRFYSHLTWDDGQIQEDVIENIDQPNTYLGVKADASYKMSRLIYSTDLKFFAGYRFNHDKDRETILDVASSTIDALNSYNRRMTENVYTMGVNCVHRYTKDNYAHGLESNLNFPVSIVDRNTSYSRSTLDTCLAQSPVFFEPSVAITYYRTTKQHQRETLFELSSSLKYSLPEVNQLITLPVTSDRINIYQGNASLKSPAVWKSSLMWKIPLKQRLAYLKHSLTYIYYIDRIIYSYSYVDGVYTNKPDNIAGTWNFQYSFRGQHYIKGKNFNYTFSCEYNRMKNFVAEGTTGTYNQIKNDELHLSLPVTFWGYFTKDRKLSGGVNVSIDWRKPLNDRPDLGYNNTWQYKVKPWVAVSLPADIDFNTDCDVVKRTGYSNEELNKFTYVWNMELSKPIFKDKILLKLKAIDILRQYKSVAYIVNERGIRETRAITLPSYLLFSVTCKFNKQPMKK